MGQMDRLVSHSWLQEVEQTAIKVDESMPFAGAVCPGLGAAKGIGLVVHLGVALPAAKLVLPLNDHACHGFGVACLDAALFLRLQIDSRAKDKVAGSSVIA